MPSCALPGCAVALATVGANSGPAGAVEATGSAGASATEGGKTPAAEAFRVAEDLQMATQAIARAARKTTVHDNILFVFERGVVLS